jgi:hypothetical protein
MGVEGEAGVDSLRLSRPFPNLYGGDGLTTKIRMTAMTQNGRGFVAFVRIPEHVNSFKLGTKSRIDLTHGLRYFKEQEAQKNHEPQSFVREVRS